MARRTQLFWFVLTVVIVVAIVVIKTNQAPAYKRGTSPTYDNALAAAVALYKGMAVAKVDMSNGPCLTNDLMPGWVVDIVHTPREPVDDLPANQCQAYLEGRAAHFVELDTNGNLVRIR